MLINLITFTVGLLSGWWPWCGSFRQRQATSSLALSSVVVLAGSQRRRPGNATRQAHQQRRGKLVFWPSLFVRRQWQRAKPKTDQLGKRES